MDFFNPNASQVWGEGLAKVYDQAQFDGIWLDQNEPTGYCDGECPMGFEGNQTH